jgi:hypothetical protein
LTLARERPRRERRKPGAPVVRAVLGFVVLAAVFVAGLALGRAIEEAPRPGGTQSLVRTLEPDTLPPVTRTVTVSTSSP